jgi:hypothetical protein
MPHSYGTLNIYDVFTPEMNFGATICTKPTALFKISELTLSLALRLDTPQYLESISLREIR